MVTGTSTAALAGQIHHTKVLKKQGSRCGLLLGTGASPLLD
jgi:hypothetical protein